LNNNNEINKEVKEDDVMGVRSMQLLEIAYTLML